MKTLSISAVFRVRTLVAFSLTANSNSSLHWNTIGETCINNIYIYIYQLIYVNFINAACQNIVACLL